MTQSHVDSLIRRMLEKECTVNECYLILSVAEQVKILKQLLNTYAEASPELKNKIDYASFQVIQAAWCCYEDLTDVIVHYPFVKGVNEGVKQRLNSGLFSLALLHSMNKSQRYNIFWVHTIEQTTIARKFKESDMDANLNRMYEDLKSALVITLYQ